MVINDEDVVRDVLTALMEVGITTATVIESQGMGAIVSEKMPIFAGFRNLWGGASPYNTTIFTVVEDDLLEEALGLMSESEKNGYIHTVWTYRTPFVGKMCNCDIPDCVAFSTRRNFGTRLVYKSEYVFSVDPELCNGCRSCIRQCQFGAISYSPISEKCVINPDLCYGCGVCRIACKKEAIRKRDRTPVLGW